MKGLIILLHAMNTLRIKIKLFLLLITIFNCGVTKVYNRDSRSTFSMKRYEYTLMSNIFITDLELEVDAKELCSPLYNTTITIERTFLDSFISHWTFGILHRRTKLIISCEN